MIETFHPGLVFQCPFIWLWISVFCYHVLQEETFLLLVMLVLVSFFVCLFSVVVCVCVCVFFKLSLLIHSSFLLPPCHFVRWDVACPIACIWRSEDNFGIGSLFLSRESQAWNSSPRPWQQESLFTESSFWP